jgi:hypothetical protein
VEVPGIDALGGRLVLGPLEKFAPASRIQSASRVVSSRLVERVPSKDLGTAQIELPVGHVAEVVDHVPFARSGGRKDLLIAEPRKGLDVIVVEFRE